jgi:AraC-like DNA-binding protein
MSSRLDIVPDWKRRARRAEYDPVNLACACHVTLRRLEQFFRQRRRTTPRAWLRHVQMDDALEKIRQGMEPKAVAAELGFNCVACFFRAFRQEFGRPLRQIIAESRRTRP